MKTLVTGGAGFIGSTLVDRLLNDGHDVVVIDNLSSGKLSNLEHARMKYEDRLTFHELDIRDARTRDVIIEAQCEVVFHLAAQMDVRVSVADPVFDAEVNVIGSLNVLEGARLSGVRKVIFASSGGTIYGEASDDVLPANESAPQIPVSPYGITKKVFGDYLFAYREIHGQDYVALALGNIFGPRQDPHGEAGVIAIFGQRLLAGQPCTIFGDGSATRDYVYVDDVVEAFVLSASKGTGLYNIGRGIETSTRELYSALATAAGIQEEPVTAAARTGEIQRAVLDSSKAHAELGWKPKMSLEQGLQNVLDFIRSEK